MMFILNGLLIDEEKRKLDAVLDAAHTIVSYYHEQAESGQLTEQQARQQAFNRLDEIRYEGAEYIFTLNRQGEMVQHPFTKSLVGKNVLSYEDPEGTRLFQEMINKARSSDRGTRVHLQKAAIVTIWFLRSAEFGFSNLNIILGTGQYTDNTLFYGRSF